MRIRSIHNQHRQDGITLLVTLLLMGVLLGVSTSLLNVTLKQFQLSGFSLASEIAFQAANAGMECAVYQDFINNAFSVPGDGTTEQSLIPEVSCMGVLNVQSKDYDNGLYNDPDATPTDPGDGKAISGAEQRFQFSWGTPAVCTEVSVYKFYSSSAPVSVTVNGVSMRSSTCPAGSVCTVVQARGHNVGCSVINTSANVVEREYTQVY